MTLRQPSELRQTQQLISGIIRANPTKLIISAMASGKTGATLDALRKMLDRFEVHHVLVIAPRFVAANTWPDEIESWSHTRPLSYAIAVGEPEERAAAVAKRAEITCINFENLPWLAKHIRTVENWFFDCVVIDESSRFKSGEGRTKATKVKTVNKAGEVVVKARPGGNMTRFGIMTTARRKIERVIELTGTPAPQGLIDLWGQAYLLDQGQALGRDKSEFERRWFDKDPYTYAVTPKPGAEIEILNRLKHLLVTIPQEKVTSDAQFVPMKVRLPEKAMGEYREFEKTLVSQPYDVEAVSNGVLANKLLQFCIAEDTEALTEFGWVKIQKVTPGTKVWDGVEWVSCGGAIARGTRLTIDCYGVRMTPDHEVLTKRGWKQAQEIDDGESRVRFERADVRLPNSPPAARNQRTQLRNMVSTMCLRQGNRPKESKFAIDNARSNEVVRLQARGESVSRARWAYDDRESAVGDLAADAQPMPQSEIQRFQELRRPWDKHARRMVSVISSVLARCTKGLFGRVDNRSTQQQRKLQSVEFSMDHIDCPGQKQTNDALRGQPVGANYRGRGSRAERNKVHYPAPESAEGSYGRRVVCAGRDEKCQPTYDLLDSGPRNQFVVRGRDGCLIVHNCNGHMYREDRSVVHIHDAKMDALDELIEVSKGENLLVFYSFKFDKDSIRARYPHAVVANESKDFVTDWNKGKIRLGLAHPASIGHGTNLQWGGHIAAWYGLTFSLELWLQANMRLPRPGQTKQVLIYPIIAEGTYDERALTILNDKDSTQARIVNSFSLLT